MNAEAFIFMHMYTVTDCSPHTHNSSVKILPALRPTLTDRESFFLNSCSSDERSFNLSFINYIPYTQKVSQQQAV